MAHLLGAEQIRVVYPSKVVIDNVTVGLGDGDRIGVVGRNGDGKSTLLALLAQKITPDAGRVTKKSGVSIGYLEQRDDLDPSHSVGENVLGDLPEYQWGSNPAVREILAGILPDINLAVMVGELSGGERRRVALAKLLIDDWDILLLDEPTNHLDIQGVVWLARHLKSRWGTQEGALVVVTHDRWFLDEVSTRTWEVFGGSIESFEGGYASYVLKRVERDRLENQRENRRENLMRKELAWLRRGPPARTSKPQFRIDAANALIADEPPLRNAVELKALAFSRLGRIVVDMKNVSYSFGSRMVVQNLNWSVGPGDRVGILGSNGVGKSTLLDLITGALAPDSGSVEIGTTVKLATLAQGDAAILNVGKKRLYEIMAERRSSYLIGGREVGSGQLLERLGFSALDMQARAFEFSGGQRRRLQLLLALLDEPNVLVLDEPTNDMDIEMLTVIEDLLDTWSGSLIVVSHDRYLIERTCDRLFGMTNGGLFELTRGVDQFLELSKNRESDPKTGELPSLDLSNQGSKSNERKALRSNSKELVRVERKIKRIETEIREGRAQLDKHDYADYAGVAAQTKLIKILEDQVLELEDAWLKLSLDNENS